MTSPHPSHDAGLQTIGFLVVAVLVLIGMAAGRYTGLDDARRACVATCECPHKEVAP